MSTEELTIQYSGPALVDHTMDLAIFSSSLLALDHMCQGANSILNGASATDIQVKLKAPHQGCVSITIQIIEVTIQAAPLVSVGDILKALGLIGTGISGLLWLMKRRKKRKIRQALLNMVNFYRPPDDWDEEKIAEVLAEVEALKNSMSLRIEGEPKLVDASLDTMRLYCDASIRMAQQQFVAPLEAEGIEQIRIQHNGETVGIVEKEDVTNEYYDVIDAEEVSRILPMIPTRNPA